MASQATDPAFIRSEITRGFQQRYGRNPTEAEMAQWVGYAGRDTYSDRKVREGWNPYLWDRLVTPGSEESSSVDPGEETVIGYESTPTSSRQSQSFSNYAPTMSLDSQLPTSGLNATGYEAVEPLPLIGQTDPQVNTRRQMQREALIAQLR